LPPLPASTKHAQEPVWHSKMALQGRVLPSHGSAMQRLSPPHLPFRQ
jgi:hypothetical protein